MLYNDGTVNTLISDMGRYKNSLTTEMQKAQDAKNNLLSQAWDSGTDTGASANFGRKHAQLMQDLEDLINTLSLGTQHVEDALNRARQTDTKVADDFTW